MADFHPAFEQPPGMTTCCFCFGVPANVCPDLAFEAKQCEGNFSRPPPCGSFNGEDEKYYLKKTITRTKVTRTKSPPPSTLSCTPVSGLARHTTIGTTTEDVNYDSLVVTTCEVDPEDYSCDCTTEATPATYELERQLVRVYDISDATCTGSSFEAPGAYITELDPDLSTEETAYEDEWEPVTGEQVKAKAIELAEEDCDLEGPWEDTAVGLKAITENEELEVVQALAAITRTRFHLQGGSTGYVRFVYGILDENSVIIEETEVVFTWDPTLGPLDATLPGPDLDPGWPPGGGDTLRLRELVLIGISCDPTEEED